MGNFGTGPRLEAGSRLPQQTRLHRRRRDSFSVVLAMVVYLSKERGEASRAAADVRVSLFFLEMRRVFRSLDLYWRRVGRRQRFLRSIHKTPPRPAAY